MAPGARMKAASICPFMHMLFIVVTVSYFKNNTGIHSDQ